MVTEDLIIDNLKSRKQFLLVAQGVRASGRFLSLQAKRNVSKADEDCDNKIRPNEIRYGVTASKKVGNAVKRNFAKRRLRVLFNAHLPNLGKVGFDYVAVARPQTTEASWKDLENDFCFLLKKLSKSLIKSQNDFKPH